MLKLKNKAERAAYRKIKKQTGHQRYLQNLLCRADSQKWDKLDKSLSKHDMKYMDNDETQRQSLIIERTGSSLQKMTKAQLCKQEQSNNKYTQMYLQIRQQRSSDSRVQRERLNIERQVYHKIMKSSQENLSGAIAKFQQISGKLEEKYVLGHELFTQMSMNMEMKRKNQQAAKNSALNLNEFEDIENLQGIQSLSQSINVSKIEVVDQNTREIKRLTKMIHNLKKQQRLLENKEKECAAQVRSEIRLRNQFVYGIVKNGYYQENGMKWILQQMVEISLKDEMRKEGIFKIFNKRNEGSYSQQHVLKNPLENCQFMQLKQEHLPQFLDARSRTYLLCLYSEIRNTNLNRGDLKSGIESRLRVRDLSNSSLNNSKIIVDQSGVFPDINGGASNEASRSNSKENKVLASASHNDDQSGKGQRKLDRYQSILKRVSNINHKSNMDVHNSKQKFNFDIKDIYENTRESIKTWIKDKCKVLDGSRREEQKQLERKVSENKLEKRVSFSMRKAQMQIPIKVSRSSHKLEKQQRNLIKFSQQKEKKSFEFANKMESYLIGEINMPSGCSLPLIKNKKGKILPNHISSMMSRQTSEVSKKNKSLLSKCAKQMQNPQMQQQSLEELQKYEKVRVMRMYPKHLQQRAFKVLFGISQKSP